uniref:NADH dehydrogenase [ubiquinone] 1 alpha subcomplex assembly factor 3 n=1 Tax=Plectus sambesii TaxID=2011161 RepID=A0A914W7P6_9BILA
MLCGSRRSLNGSATRLCRAFLRSGGSGRLFSKASGSGERQTGAVMTDSFADDQEQYHLTPMGDSDASQKTTMTSLSAQMTQRKEMCIVGYSMFGFRINDRSFLFGPIAVFPKLALSWRVLTPDDITEESVEFFTMLDPKLDVVVIGVGDRSNLDAVRRRVMPVFSRLRIGTEILPTEDAVPVFNYLNADGRYVAAGLYPPDNFHVSRQNLLTGLNRIEPYDTLPSGMFSISDGQHSDDVTNVISDIWHGEKKSLESLSKTERDAKKRQLAADKEIANRLKDE